MSLFGFLAFIAGCTMCIIDAFVTQTAVLSYVGVACIWVTLLIYYRKDNKRNDRP